MSSTNVEPKVGQGVEAGLPVSDQTPNRIGTQVEGTGAMKATRMTTRSHQDKEKLNDVATDLSKEGEDVSPSTPRVTKPTKRSTVIELRKSLESLGLDVGGKKESLYKRLLKAFYRSDDSDCSPQTSSASDQSEEVVEDTFEKWQERAQSDWKSFLCFDVEATCRGGKEFDWPNEIIEFPVVLLRWTASDPPVKESSEQSDSTEIDGPSKRRLVKVDTFHSYVRPTWQPKLTEFCTSLTGITQEMVDKSPTFPEMLEELEVWLDKYDLRDEDNRLKNALWVTDGPWDLRDFVPKQLFITPVNPRPAYLFGQYLNIKQATQTVLSNLWRLEHPPSPSKSPTPPQEGEDDVFSSPTKAPNTRHDTLHPVITTHKTMVKAFREGKWKGPNFYHNIAGQVAALDLGEFEGRQHSGLDDAMNISRILIALSEKERVIIEPNARTPHEKHMKTWPWMGKDGKVHFEDWMSKGGTSSTPSKISPDPVLPFTWSGPTKTEGEEEVSDQVVNPADDSNKVQIHEPMVLDLRKDAMGNIRSVKVPLSQANEMTQKAYYARKGQAGQLGQTMNRDTEASEPDATDEIVERTARMNVGDVHHNHD